MNRHEAKLALSEGKKLTHNYFSEGEFCHLECVNPNTRPIKYEIVFEDGVTQDEGEFWSMRDGYQWDNGWEIFN
jgi:hypothetical protein